MYKTIDISHWKKITETTIRGRTVKNAYINPENNTVWIFKLSEISIGAYNDIRGSHWAEKMASEIGKIFGINIQKTELALCENEIGVICKVFIDIEEEFFPADSFLLDINPDDYTVGNILENTKKFLNNNNCNNIQRIKKSIINMLSFDWFIGNTDRHIENWGLIHNKKTKEFYFSPLFDNAASFTNELSLEKVDKILKDKRQFSGYQNRAKSLIRIVKGKPTKYNDIKEYLIHNYKQEFEIFKEKIFHKNEDIKQIICSFSDEILHERQKLLILKIISDKLKKIED